MGLNDASRGEKFAAHTAFAAIACRTHDHITDASTHFSFSLAFRTDIDISRTAHQKPQRELQVWQPDATMAESHAGGANAAFQRDDLTFGPGAASDGPWDQFAANKQLFGITTGFDENVYTTKLDRTTSDFKEREAKAARIAAEITGVSVALFVLVVGAVLTHSCRWICALSSWSILCYGYCSLQHPIHT